MAQMDLTVRHTGSGSAMECATPAGATITFDDPDHGTHGGSPMQHLLAAAGACALMDVDVILRKKRLTFASLRVDCSGGRPAEGTPRPFTGIHLTFRVAGAVPAKAFEDAVKLAVDKYCSVGATLAKGIPLTHSAVVEA